MLTNPVYAGAYAFGRRTARVTIENGRKRVIRSMQRDWRSWEVLIQRPPRGLHFLGRVREESTADCRQRQRQAIHEPRRCPPGEASAAWPLPLRPVRQEASCPLWRDLRYDVWAPSTNSQRRGASPSAGCASTGFFQGSARPAPAPGRGGGAGGHRSTQPEALREERSARVGPAASSLRGGRVQRQYDATDPENRLVAGELERRWNERLVAVRDLELEIDQLDADDGAGPDRGRPRAAHDAWARTWPEPGRAPAPRRRRARRSFARSSRRSSSTSSATRWS